MNVRDTEAPRAASLKVTTIAVPSGGASAAFCTVRLTIADCDVPAATLLNATFRTAPGPNAPKKVKAGTVNDRVASCGALLRLVTVSVRLATPPGATDRRWS
jgi:hypothetical protein